MTKDQYTELLRKILTRRSLTMRYLPLNDDDRRAMLAAIGAASVDLCSWMCRKARGRHLSICRPMRVRSRWNGG